MAGILVRFEQPASLGVDKGRNGHGEVSGHDLGDAFHRPALAEPADLLLDPLHLIVIGATEAEDKLREGAASRLHAVNQTVTIK
ncbi:MAG TPA: hypothetical protein VHJ18_29085 [Streptosporangiaceae bacterium]|nr:hypothetical protein [Streptosporangiaceae bacterium]